MEDEDESVATSDTVDRFAVARAVPGGPLRRVLARRDFRLLFSGTSVSRLGDHFVLIATPWLLLQLTDDPLLLGVGLALEGVPRAVFMLVGGAVTDRLAPRLVMVTSDVARGLLTAVLAVVVLTDAVELWMVLTFAFAFGLVSGVATPAENSIVPSLVGGDDLQTGNAVIMGVSQLAGFVGPTLAGAIIARFSDSMTGVGTAFAIDAASFAVSAVFCSLIRNRSGALDDDGSTSGLWSSIGEGIVNVREDAPLRFVFTFLVAVNLFVVGPMLVGIPLLAHERLPQGATAFGILMGAFSMGNLVGYVVAGGAPKASTTMMRAIVLGVLASFGAAIASFGVAANLWLDALLLVGLGAGNGYLTVILFTWIQNRTPVEMLGRTTSLVTFASLGLVSVSQTSAGALAAWNLDALFLISGALILAMTAWSATKPGLRAFTDSLVAIEVPRREESCS